MKIFLGRKLKDLAASDPELFEKVITKLGVPLNTGQAIKLLELSDFYLVDNHAFLDGNKNKFQSKTYSRSISIANRHKAFMSMFPMLNFTFEVGRGIMTATLSDSKGELQQPTIIKGQNPWSSKITPNIPSFMGFIDLLVEYKAQPIGKDNMELAWEFFLLEDIKPRVEDLEQPDLEALKADSKVKTMSVASE